MLAATLTFRLCTAPCWAGGHRRLHPGIRARLTLKPR